jgi:hypothetical protein
MLSHSGANTPQLDHPLLYKRGVYKFNYFLMVGEAGLEPATPGLEGRCSIQLSYSPVPSYCNFEVSVAGGTVVGIVAAKSLMAEINAASTETGALFRPMARR